MMSVISERINPGEREKAQPLHFPRGIKEGRILSLMTL